jgi:hypothetical protein
VWLHHKIAAGGGRRKKKKIKDQNKNPTGSLLNNYEKIKCKFRIIFMEKVILNSIFFCCIGSKNCETTKDHTISLKFPTARHKGWGGGRGAQIERIRTWAHPSKHLS